MNPSSLRIAVTRLHRPINDSERPSEEKERFRQALYNDAYFSDDTGMSGSKMRNTKVSLSEPEMPRVHNPKTKCEMGVFP